MWWLGPAMQLARSRKCETSAGKTCGSTSAEKVTSATRATISMPRWAREVPAVGAIGTSTIGGECTERRRAARAGACRRRVAGAPRGQGYSRRPVDATEPAVLPADHPPATRSTALAVTLLAVLLAAGLVGLRVRAVGSVTGLLSVGPTSPAFPLVRREVPRLAVVREAGHDGAYFYAIARRPFDVTRTARYLAPPTFRYRRILFPLVAGRLAPGGGVALVYAFLAVSLLGVALGAWSLSRLPGAPPWLPLLMTLNPGVLAALFLSLSDALAVGLTLADFAAMARRRVALAVVCLVLAALTRETSLLAAVALACWPGLPRRQRAAVGLLPAVPLVLWSAWVAARSHTSSFAQPQAGIFTWPFAGWLHGGTPVGQLLWVLVLPVTLVAALVRGRGQPRSYSLYVGGCLVLLVCARHRPSPAAGTTPPGWWRRRSRWPSGCSWHRQPALVGAH